jgi:hypothetical protein
MLPFSLTRMDAHLLNWLLIPACLALSFLLSGMEAGVFALSRLRVRQQMRAGRASAKVLHDFLERPESFLWTILVGNTVVNFVCFGWTVAVLHGRFGWSFLSASVFVVAVFLFYALFDLLPKMLFRTYPNRLCLLSAQPFRVVHLVLRPLVALVEGVSGTLLRWTGGKVFFRSLVWQPRGTAPDDAGIGAGIFLRRTRHDQPCARFAVADRAAGGEAVGRSRHGHDPDDAAGGAGTGPRSRFISVACLG